MLQLRAFISSATGLIILALLAALAIQTARIEGFKIWPISIKGLSEKLRDANAKIIEMSSAKNEQRGETDRNIGKANERIIYIDRKAREVEAAPLPGSCKTPEIIMRNPDL